jgi:hypothetical protein
MRVREAHEMSKTDRIASMFTADPITVLTPKEISVQLDMDIRIVTSIVNRLRDEGSIERVGWGRYRLKTGMVVDEKAIVGISDDLIRLSSEVLGKIEEDRSIWGENRLARLLWIYEKISKIGGEPFALNMLRICTKKWLDEEGAKVMIRIVSEGVN